MHIAHPALTMSGKRKGKQKFRNADEARKARELAEEWERNLAKWQSLSKPVSKNVKAKEPAFTYKITNGRETKKIPSLDSWVTGPVTSVKPMQYTGTKLIGIGTMHKSNAVPIFSDEQAKDISSMRR